MRSRALCRGKIPPRCVPGRQSVASFALHASRKWPRAGKSPVRGKIRAPCIRKRAGFGEICAPCIRNAPQIAVGGCTARRSCQEGPLFAARTPRIMHGARILPSPAPPNRSSSRNSAASEPPERSQPPAPPNSASDCNHGAALMGGGTGRGRLLVGRGDAAKGVRGVVGCLALAAKLASVKLRASL